MQDTFKRVFEIALEEVPSKLQNFQKEECILYKGFKIGHNRKGTYSWEDTRYDNYYEVVDPKITERILLDGFVKTLNTVMLHNDEERVLRTKREIEKVDMVIGQWSKKSISLWNEFNNELKKTNKDEIDKGKKEKKISALRKKYDRDKQLYQKRRGVLSEEKEELKRDLNFFEARIKMYNN